MWWRRSRPGRKRMLTVDKPSDKLGSSAAAAATTTTATTAAAATATRLNNVAVEVEVAVRGKVDVGTTGWRVEPGVVVPALALPQAAMLLHQHLLHHHQLFHPGCPLVHRPSWRAKRTFPRFHERPRSSFSMFIVAVMLASLQLL